MKNLQGNGKKLLVVGLARSGVSAAKLGLEKGFDVTVSDLNGPERLSEAMETLRKLPVHFALGQDGTAQAAGADLIVISPGVPLSAPVVSFAREKGISLTGELEFASWYCPCPYVAVTGTNGKTTTTTLVDEMFKASGMRSFAAGNIGLPFSEVVPDCVPDGRVAVEVSSFQLETTREFHPSAAAVLNVTEDHLNRHGTMEVYTGLKAHVFDAMGPQDTAVLNFEDASCRAMRDGQPARLLWFSSLQEVDRGICLNGKGGMVFRDGDKETGICRPDEIRIPGRHNLENAMAASALALSQGVSPEVIREVLMHFPGVEHRIEFVEEKNGIRFINDSKGTNSDSTLKAIDAMKAPTVLILGGYDKHVSFDALARAVQESPMIRRCVLMGQTAPQISDALRNAGFEDFETAQDLREALEVCVRAASAGWNVLFSPACASFDMFRDYEERGRIFKQLVHELD